MNLRPLSAEQVTRLLTLEELTAIGETPNSEMFGRILTKVVIAQRDQDQGVISDLYEALKAIVERTEQGLALGEKLDLEPARQALAKVEGK